MRHSFTIPLISIGLIFSFSVLAQEKISFPGDRCSKAKSDHLAAEHEWSSINADVSFFREELERFRNLRGETKITLSVLNDIFNIMKEKGNLTDAQRLTLNSRIPNNKGIINPEETFTMSGLETLPLKMEEAKATMNRLLSWIEENIKKTETELKEKEKRSHLLSEKLANMEEVVEKECKATGSPTPWEQGLPRTTGKDIYQRYVEKETMRNEEVESRRLTDIERIWLRYYPPYPPYSRYPPFSSPSHPYGYSSRALLIELKNVGQSRICLRCYPFNSPWEEKQIHWQLDRAKNEHDSLSLPCVGPLGEYRTIQVYENIQDCYPKMTR